MRVRSRELLESSTRTASVSRRSMSAGIWGTTETDEFVMDGPSAQQTTADYVTSNFKKRSAEGVIVNNPYSSVTTQTFPWAPTSLFKTVIRGTGDKEYRHEWSGSIAPFATGYETVIPLHMVQPAAVNEIRSKVYNLAVARAHANVNPSEMLALASIGEASQTIEYMAKTMTQAATLLRRARRLDFDLFKANSLLLSAKSRSRRKYAQDQLRAISEQYMGVRYGLRPLVFDAKSAYAAYHAKLIPKRMRQTYRSKESDQFRADETQRDIPIYWETIVDVEKKFSYSVNARAGVLCDVNRSAVQAWGGDKFLQSAWELLPASFIADWFANIGDIIGASAPKAGVSQLASWVVLEEKFEYEMSLVNSRSTSPNLYGYTTNVAEVGSSKSRYIVTSKQRFVEPVLSMIPEVDIHLDSYKLTDLAIILRGIFR